MPRLLLSLSALAVALGGCVSIASESARQLDEVGDVELTTVLCASRANAGVDCPASNTSEIDVGGEYQVLLAHRIPAQASPPETIASSDVPLTLSRSASYTAELDRLAPPGPGRRWVGYVSPSFRYDPLRGEQAATVLTRVQLVRGADGSPFIAPFRYRTIVGYRETAPDPNRPVRCGDALRITHFEDATTCQTYPGEKGLESDLALETRDLGLIAGAAGSAERGGSGSVTFTAVYSGRGASPAFALTATTSVPGGGAAPAAASIAPTAPGGTPVGVTVSVPASTPRGVYDVTLTATGPGGQARRATALLTVTGSEPADRTPPEVALRMKSRPRVKRALVVGMVADVSCSEPCLLAGELRAGRRTARALRVAIPRGDRAVTVGAVAETGHAAGRRNVRIRFRRGLGPRLRRLPRVPLALRVTARDRAGNVRRRTVTFALRR